MIRINLLPAEFRKTKGSASPVPYLSLAILAGGLFLLLTLFFYADYLKVKSSYAIVYTEWVRVSPEMAQLKKMETKVEAEMKAEKEFLEKNILNTDSMTGVMMEVSEHLPQQGWLTELKLERVPQGVAMNLKGKVLPSRALTGIEQIEQFLQQVKSRMPQAVPTLTTAKGDAKAEGATSFEADFKWGAAKK
ncbi:MAG TPA: hypothetical protein PLL75_07305 [Candidatus Omnitrophota bacterium]|nr:hypothetical protein [Candidatus Omnitrophota bacterium]HPS37514.1 hypothetical protein [Candidatus Omnitrophota bacterium]